MLMSGAAGALQNNGGEPSAGVVKCFGVYSTCMDNCDSLSRTEADQNRCEAGCKFNYDVCKTAYPNVQSPASGSKGSPPKAFGH